MDPFRVEGPAVISFSGGRSSGYMLRRILTAHGGKLPADVFVLFANTGKEMPETLDFVRECSQRWAVPIHWLEYTTGRKWREVDYETASRNSEPFTLAIEERSFLPNVAMRFCTESLKLAPIAGFMKARGFDEWTNIIGLRADEPRRLARMRAKEDDSIAPMAAAGIGVADVKAFWDGYKFDLRIPSTHSNCDLCFLKGAELVVSLIREKPERAEWWMAQERKIGARFSSDRPTYVQMHKHVAAHDELFAFGDEAFADCSCTD